MAAFYFRCPKCTHSFGRILSEAPKHQPCPECGAKAKRRARPMTATVKETVDSGLMARRLERLQGATEIYEERSRADKSKIDIAITRGTVGIPSEG